MSMRSASCSASAPEGDSLRVEIGRTRSARAFICRQGVDHARRRLADGQRGGRPARRLGSFRAQHHPRILLCRRPSPTLLPAARSISRSTCSHAISAGWSSFAMSTDPQTARLRHGFLSSPEEIIDEARNGRMFILVDDEDRENEGDLVIPAQMATPDAINFMATHGRGLICLALTRERVEQLGLDLMSRDNGTRHETAFTVSIEAREGVTTGISAADRARTISVAIDASKGPEHIVTPGHVFPLVAQRRRRAGARRPYRGGGRRVAPRRAQPVGRDLRDHEGRRHDGAARRSRRLRAASRPEDRHDPRSDRLSPPHDHNVEKTPRRISTAARAAIGGDHLSATRQSAPKRWRW